MKNKIVEHHKIESGCKKRFKALKIPISTIRAIIKRFQSTKKLQICLEEDVCLYHPNTRWGGEFEWPKTLQGPQLENCRERLSFGVRKLKKKNQTSPISPHVVREGFKKKFSSLIQKQTPANSVVRHDWNFKWHWLLWSDETKKKELFGSKPTRWV